MAGGGEVSTILKFCLFFFNFVFWFTGIAFIVIGSWAYIEKHAPSDDPGEKSSSEELFDLLFDLTIFLIVLGSIIFIIAFAGCLGALRENICLLKFFSYSLGALLVLEIVLIVLAFFFKPKIEAKISEVFRAEGIARYRDDDDLRNMIDWSQKKFQCCGIGPHGYRDWSMNPYFNCSDTNPSMEKCGVPYSCCRPPEDINETYVNMQCGYGMQKLLRSDAEKFIYTYGCVTQLIEWGKQNLYIIGGVVLGVAVIEILGLVLARSLANQIEDYSYSGGF